MSTEALSNVKGITLAVSSVLVVFAALYGLFTWRRELTGKAKFEIARNIAFLVHKVNEDFRWARFPFSSSTEAIGRPKNTSESAAEAQTLDEWYIRNSRLDILREDLSKLQAAGWEAEVVLGKGAGKGVTEAITTYKACFGDLASSVNSYFDVRLQQVKGYAGNWDAEWLNSLRKTIYSTEGDDMSVRVEKIKNVVTSSLRTYLR